MEDGEVWIIGLCLDSQWTFWRLPNQAFVIYGNKCVIVSVLLLFYSKGGLERLSTLKVETDTSLMMYVVIMSLYS